MRTADYCSTRTQEGIYSPDPQAAATQLQMPASTAQRLSCHSLLLPSPPVPQGQQNVLQWSHYGSRSSERWCLTSLLPHSPAGDESSSRQKRSQDCGLTYLHHWLISKDRFAAPVRRGWDQTGTSKLAPDSQDQNDGHPNWDQSKPGITVSYLHQ